MITKIDYLLEYEKNIGYKYGKNYFEVSVFVKLKDIKFGYLDNYNKGIDSDPKYEWDILRESIKTKGWSPNDFGYVTISEDNYCINGHHRIVLLKEIFGDYFEVEVIRLKGSYRVILFKNILTDLFNLRLKRKKWYI